MTKKTGNIFKRMGSMIPSPLWEAHNGGRLRRREDRVGEYILLVAFFLYCVKYTFDYSAVFVRSALLNTLLLVVSVGLPVFKIVFMQSYTPARLIATAAIAGVTCISCLMGGNYLFLNGFLFILAMQDVDFDRVVRLGYRFKVASLVVHVVWYIIMFIVTPDSIDFIYRTEGEPRHYFLMGHPNLFMAILVWTCLEFIYLNYKRLRLYHFAIMWAVNLAFYVFTDSNTGMVVLAVSNILIALDKMGRGRFDKSLAVLAKYTYTFCAVLFSLIAIVYTLLGPEQKAIWLDLDALLTGRMWYGAYGFGVYGVTLMGRQIVFPEKIFWEGRWFDSFPYFDNCYHGNLILFGILHLVLTALAYIVLGGKMETRDKIIAVAFALYGGMESYMTNVLICFALLAIGKYLYPAKKKLPS